MKRQLGIRLDLEVRNQRILVLYARHIHRKRIAAMMKMQYETVNKVLQKYQGIERRKIVRYNQTSAAPFLHSDR